MKTAICLKCNFQMRGRFTHGAPAACPACGYDKSKEDLQKMAQAKLKDKQEKQDDSNTKR